MVAGAALPNLPLKQGELAVNVPDQQIFTTDTGTPVPLIGVRIWSLTSSYKVGDLVARQGQVFSCLVDIAPKGFDPADWQAIADANTQAMIDASLAAFTMPVAKISDSTIFGQNMVKAADAAAGRAVLGIPLPLTIGQGGTGATTAAQARTNLGIYNADGSFALADGTAGAPGLYFANEPQLGIFRSAAGVIRMGAGGKESFVFDMSASNSANFTIVPRAIGSAGLTFGTTPAGSADRSTLAIGINGGEGFIAVGKIGAAAVLPLTLYGNPTINLNGDVWTNANINTMGSAYIKGGSIELGPTADGSAYIDFHNTAAQDFSMRLAMWGTSPDYLRCISLSGLARFQVSGAASGILFENIATQSGSNTIAFGWRGDGTLGLRVDNTQFNANWPINITGYAASSGYSANSGQLEGHASSWFIQSDVCKAAGFVSGDLAQPYMRHTATDTVQRIIYQTTNDMSIRAIRDSSDGSGRYLETTGSGGAFGVRYNVSDIRLKTNIAPTEVDASAAIRALEFIAFDWIEERAGTRGHMPIGTSAQNMKAQDINLANGIAQPEGSPNYDLGEVLQPNDPYFLVYVAKAVQEILARVDALEAA